MRLFLAINFPPAERERLHRAAAGLRAARLPVRWVEAEALHLTLKFLGEVPEPRLAEIEAEARTVAAQQAAFTLRLHGLGAFPNERNPRVIWVGIQAPPVLARLAGALEDALADRGFARESRPFAPHLTLGRAQREARAGDFRRLGELAAAFDHDARVDVRSLDLMRSHLSPRGARYERLLAAPLAGGAPAGAGPAGPARDEPGTISPGAAP
jgi:2'-5' RNA ligase